MEYVSTVWALYMKSSVEKFEDKQRYTARFVVSEYDHLSSISSTLNQLNWLRLAIKRQVSRLMMLYKTIIMFHLSKYFYITKLLGCKTNFSHLQLIVEYIRD